MSDLFWQRPPLLSWGAPALAIAAGVGFGAAFLPPALVGGFLVAILGAILIAIKPTFGLALALLAGPFGALESNVLGNRLINSGQFLLLATLGAWFGHLVRRRKIIITGTSLTRPLALLVGFVVLSLLDAPSLRLGITEVAKWLEMGAVMVLVVDMASVSQSHGRPRTRWLVTMLLLAGLSQALIGIWQFGLRADGPEHFLISDRLYRAYGTFEQPNPFGGYMAISAALGLGTLLGLFMAAFQGRGMSGANGSGMGPFSARESTSRFLRVRPLDRWGWPLFVAICCGAVGLALLFSWSRGAWLGFGAAAVAIAFFFPRRRRNGVLLIGLAIVILLIGNQLGLLPSAVASRLGSITEDLRFGDIRGLDINDANYAVLERLAHWQAALNMAGDQPWLGVGFGNYESAYADYALINWPYPLGHAHNYYLNILAETGVLGSAAYLFFWGAVLSQAARLLTQAWWPERGVILGLMAAWFALAVHHLVDNLYVNNLYIYFGALLGLQQVLAIKIRSDTRKVFRDRASGRDS